MSFYSRTLDVISNIHLNDGPFDFPLMIDGDEFVWILLRSNGNTIQVFHPISLKICATICLNKIFDRMGKTIEQLAKIDELEDRDDDLRNSINDVSISSIFIHDQLCWIGSSTGIVYVFEYHFVWKPTRPNAVRSTSFQIQFEKDFLKKNRSLSESALSFTESDSFSDESSSIEISTDDQISNIFERRNRSKTNFFPARLNFSLSFKAKIADSPVKSICKSQ